MFKVHLRRWTRLSRSLMYHMHYILHLSEVLFSVRLDGCSILHVQLIEEFF